MSRSLLTILLLGVLGTTAVVVQDRAADVEIVGHIVKPEQLILEPGEVKGLNAPSGFTVTIFAEGLGKPRMLDVAEDGSVYVTRREPGDVLVLRDTDGNGASDQVRTAVRRPMLHGLAVDGRRAYLVSVNDVFTADIGADGTFTNITRIVDDLPEAGQHANRTIRLGPDKHLYVSVGSTCNACNETSPENATIVRVAPDGTSRQVFASGLRNTIGFDWHPESGTLFGMDHGIDWLGDDEQGEELNQIQRGKQYGWPYVYGTGKLNPQDEPPGAMSSEEWARLSTNPVATYTAHAAPMQMRFYTGHQFPAEYRADAFVAMRGSWNRQTPSGYEVVRIRFQNGAPTAIEPFLTGFVTTANGRPATIGRPVGVAIAQDGALLISDEAAGRIYRVAYRGSGATMTRSDPPSTDVPTATTGTRDTPNDGLVAMARDETRTSGQLSVTSPAFQSGAAIPTPYTAYGERFSPALRWTNAPPATRSFVLLMEDPDAKAPKPYVHWLLYNLPADTTELPESVPTHPRLEQPRGAVQGRNSRGQIGYAGPRPPAGDAPHHYHFQVLALDTTLALEPGAEREAVLRALAGHVLARGELVGTYQAPR